MHREVGDSRAGDSGANACAIHNLPSVQFELVSFSAVRVADGRQGITAAMFDQPDGRRRFAVKLGMFYGALFVVYGMHVPFMPVWFDWRGLTSGEISAVVAAPFFLRLLITPAVALAADRNGAHREILIVLAWISLGLVLALSQMSGFWAVFVFAVALVICNSTIMPLTETLAVTGVRTAGLDYGRMRLWGSLTFVAASFIGGITVTQFGEGAGVWLVAAGCALTVMAAHLLPQTKAAPTSSPTSDPLAEAVAQKHLPIWQAAEPRALLAAPAFRLFLLAAGTVQAAHATFLTFGTLVWQKQGLSGTWIGTLWAIGVFAEVALFAVSGWLVATFGVARLLMIGAAASVVRWGIMAAEPGLAVLVPLQVLHGVTYGATHIAAIHFIHRAVPRHASGTGQALYATVAAGIAMGVATVLAGWLYASGGAASYLAMSGLSVVAIYAAWRLLSVWSGGHVLPDVADNDDQRPNRDGGVPSNSRSETALSQLPPEPHLGG